jgi:hypothetical protein
MEFLSPLQINYNIQMYARNKFDKPQFSFNQNLRDVRNDPVQQYIEKAASVFRFTLEIPDPSNAATSSSNGEGASGKSAAQTALRELVRVLEILIFFIF